MLTKQKKKGLIKESKCIYKNYKDENLFLKIGIIEQPNILCKSVLDIFSSCNEPCKSSFIDNIIIKTQKTFHH
ncbi:hypothetical protein [Persephonella sp.]